MISITEVRSRRSLPFIPNQLSRGKSAAYLLIYCSDHRIRWFNCGSDSDSVRSEFSGQSAYDILGLLETSSSDEIKASFRKLAKETHPDLADPKDDPAASQRFVQILAAYEILSDPVKRAHYDSFLFAQRKAIRKQGSYDSKLYVYKSHQKKFQQMEVVEWLKYYRFSINEILSERKLVDGTDYLDELERDFYSAMHVAFYGPTIESMEFLPDCFEAEERSTYETPEILHLVSGRDLFGMVCLADKVRKLPFGTFEKLFSSTSICLDITRTSEKASSRMNLDGEFELGLSQASTYHVSDAYDDLELHICGRIVAKASRIPPNFDGENIENKDDEDKINVFLSSDYEPLHSGDASEPKIPLGTITGLGTSQEEGSCSVYNNSGTKTHVIMKHRTMMVKHMHWYSAGEKVSVCECRCSRARLLPSKFWLFEPRCGMHDVGGWYVETFGKNKKGHTVPSRRFWDGFDAHEQGQDQLHPAMYLLALAYRTLDIEVARRRKKTIRDAIKVRLLRALSWSKKLM